MNNPFVNITTTLAAFLFCMKSLHLSKCKFSSLLHLIPSQGKWEGGGYYRRHYLILSCCLFSLKCTAVGFGSEEVGGVIIYLSYKMRFWVSSALYRHNCNCISTHLKRTAAVYGSESISWLVERNESKIECLNFWIWNAI